MNVTGSRDNRLSLETWNEPEMRRALADRDISAVYRLLRRVGLSQRYIAALTGQSQSEVSEILKGRQVMAYDVLVRIAAGLGIPRGYMGLAYDPATATSMVGPPDDAENAQAKEDESVKRRELLAHGTAMVFGTTVLEADHGEWLSNLAQTPMPSQIGVTDVRQVEATTRALRSLDNQYGGGTCRDAAIAQLSWAKRLLGASAKDEVRLRLFRALGDLQGVAGWTSFDVGLLDSARSHYAAALEFAKQAGDYDLMSSILYRIGRIYLHRRDANEALKWFQLGQIAAQNAGAEQAVALLCANEAVAYSYLGDDVQAEKLLERAQSELARVDPNQVPSWYKFFDKNDMCAAVGQVHCELAAFEPRHAPLAISAFQQCVPGYDYRWARAQAFSMGMLATSHMRNGDINEGIRVGRQAVVAASTLNSTRVIDRLEPFEIEAKKLSNNSDCRELCHLIQVQRGVSV